MTNPHRAQPLWTLPQAGNCREPAACFRRDSFAGGCWSPAEQDKGSGWQQGISGDVRGPCGAGWAPGCREHHPFPSFRSPRLCVEELAPASWLSALVPRRCRVHEKGDAQVGTSALPARDTDDLGLTPWCWDMMSWTSHSMPGGRGISGGACHSCICLPGCAHGHT